MFKNNSIDITSLLLQAVNLDVLFKDFNNTDLMKELQHQNSDYLEKIIEQNNKILKLLERREKMDKTIENFEKYIKEQGEQNIDSIDMDYMFKAVDIYKDLKEVENMNNGYGRYGREAYGEYNEYNEYNNSYGRRGVDSRYRGEDYMDSMRGSYRNYEEARNEYNRGNYGAKEDGLKDLEYMMHAAMKFIKMIKSEATSPEEQEIVRKHIAKISEM